MGINRNIVECKSSAAAVTIHAVNRINRNIVECKSGIVTSVSSGSESVLIETLWNVNSPLIVVLGDSDHCINRNIVECKLDTA